MEMTSFLHILMTFFPLLPCVVNACDINYWGGPSSSNALHKKMACRFTRGTVGQSATRATLQSNVKQGPKTAHNEKLLQHRTIFHLEQPFKSNPCHFCPNLVVWKYRAAAWLSDWWVDECSARFAQMCVHACMLSSTHSFFLRWTNCSQCFSSPNEHEISESI